jgi:hypothetical protein
MLQINDTDMGFATHPQFTIPTLILHLALNVSSFEFKIPHRRIKEGSRIWPEYRLHSLIFASRSIVTIFWYWLEQQNQWEPMYAVNVAIVLATMLAADVSTESQRKHSSSTIRDLDISLATTYFFSVCQFYATAGVLWGLRRSTIQFLNVWVVQLNPFLMTLRRKNLISHQATVTIYGGMLVFGVFSVGYEYLRYGTAMLRTVAFVGNLAILWRMAPLSYLLPPGVPPRKIQNKYLIWTVLGIVVNTFLRPLALQEVSFQRHLLYTSSMILVIVNGVVKCQSQNYSHGVDSEDTAEKSVKAN